MSCSLLFALVLSLIQSGAGYPNGAPTDTCFTMYPHHSVNARQDSQPPYIVELSKPVYSPGDVIEVTISGVEGRRFKGLQIAAHRDTQNPEVIVGQFVEWPKTKTKVFSCFNGFKNMATHSNPDSVSSVTLEWRAPDGYVGNITFIATIVENYSTFWTDIQTKLFAEEYTVTVDVDFPAVVVEPMPIDIDFSSCGSYKGCFLYPRQCSGLDCIAAVTYRYRPERGDYFMEMYSNSADIYQYIAVGFSSDRSMGNDETFSCVSNDGIMSIQQGYNPAHYNERLLTRYVSEAEIRKVGYQLQCRFAVPADTKVYMSEGSKDGPHYTYTDFNLDSAWYLMLAWGRANPGSDVMVRHTEMPAVSNSKVNLRSHSIVRGSAYPALVQAHAATMMIAWIFMAGIVTLVARHYKSWLPSKLLCGVKVWFQVHRCLAICILFLTALGLIYIFAKYGPGIREEATPHAYFGLAVVAGVSVQVIMGLLRPGLTHRLRPAYNWAHWFLGQCTHILAGATMFLAFYIDGITRESRDFGLLVLTIWVVCQIIMHIGFEVLKCCHARNDNPESYSIIGEKKIKLTAPEERTEKKDRAFSILFAVYVITLAGLCVACILAFVLY